MERERDIIYVYIYIYIYIYINFVYYIGERERGPLAIFEDLIT